MVIGIDDGFFKRSWKYTVISAIAYSVSRLRPTGLALDLIQVDGDDSTTIVVKLVEKVISRGYNIDMILCDTIIFAGFNVMDPYRVYEHLNKPVVSIFAYPLSKRRIRKAITHVKSWQAKYNIISRVLDEYKLVLCPKGRLYIHTVGGDFDEVINTVCKLQVYSRIPEPIHIAGVVASAIARKLIQPLLYNPR